MTPKLKYFSRCWGVLTPLDPCSYVPDIHEINLEILNRYTRRVLCIFCQFCKWYNKSGMGCKSGRIPYKKCNHKFDGKKTCYMQKNCTINTTREKLVIRQNVDRVYKNGMRKWKTFLLETCCRLLAFHFHYCLSIFHEIKRKKNSSR